MCNYPDADPRYVLLKRQEALSLEMLKYSCRISSLTHVMLSLWYKTPPKTPALGSCVCLFLSQQQHRHSVGKHHV